MTGALAVTATSGFGTLSFSFGVILGPMTAELGWSNATVSAGYTVGLFVSGAVSALVGRTIDIGGGRRALTAGTLVGGLGIVLWSSVSSLLGFFFAWLVIGIGMALSLYEPTFAAVMRHAPAHRRRSVLVITLAGALSSTIFIPLTELLVSRGDWRTALLWLALLHVALTLPGNLLFIPRGGLVLAAEPPLAVGPVADARTSSTAPPVRDAAPTLRTSVALRRAALGMVLGHAPVIAVSTHLVLFLVLGGRSPATAAVLAGGVGLGKFAGRVWFGHLARRVSSYRLVNACFLTSGAALSIPLVLPPGPLDLVMIAAFGVGAGALTVIRPLYIADLFGARGFGLTSGRINRVNKIATAFVPLFVGVSVTATGSYTAAWATLAVSQLLAVRLMPRLPGRAPSDEQDDG